LADVAGAPATSISALMTPIEVVITTTGFRGAGAASAPGTIRLARRETTRREAPRMPAF
jgi:hypothetical protein